MRRVLTILAAMVCLASGMVANAQDQAYTQTPVTVSKEKIRDNDGKVYYSHVVQDRQTLFSIAKAYGVTVNDIYDANKDLDLRNLGLKKNSILRIPATGTPQTEAAAAPVKPAEQTKTAEKPMDGGIITHVVKWYEDIEDIAAKYKVSVESILQANGLKSRKLKSRQVLRIPADEKIEKEGTAPAEPEQVTPETQVSDAEPQEHTSILEDIANFFTRKSTVNAVLMLPLNASGTPNSTNMDMYCGFLMGVRDLGEKGISTNLSVYDVANGTIPVTASKLEETDVVIGPIAVPDLQKVLAIGSDTPVVSPLDQKAESLVDGHANFIQSPASYNVQYEDLCKWIKSDFKPGDKVIVISEKGAKNTSINASVTSYLNSLGVNFTPYSYSILQGRGVTDALTQIVSKGTNRFVIASDSEAFVNDAVRNLSQLKFRKHDVVLYSSSRIRSFNTIDAENFHAVNLHASLSYYIDYDDPEVKRFLLEYRALYNTEPTRFAFQGYDLAKYFIGAVAEYGNKWQKALTRRDAEALLQNTFFFAEQEDGGLVNQGIRRVVYDADFSIRSVN